MIPCRERRCLLCHPRLLVTVPAEIAAAALTGAPFIFSVSQDAPYVTTPESWTVEPIIDFPTPPADRC